MIEITIFICCFLGMLSYLQERNIYNPILLFNGTWALILLLFRLHLYGITDVSVKIKTIILLGIISYNFGAMFSRIIRVNVVGNVLPFSELNKKSLLKVLRMMQLVAGLALLYGAIFALGVVASGNSLVYYRYMLLTPVLRAGAYGYISLYIGEALVFATAPLAIFLVFLGFRKEAIIEGLLFVEYFLFSGGGRNNILVIIVSVFICFCIFKNGIILNKKIKKTISIVMLIGLSMIVIVPIMRGSNVYKSLYMYFCGTIRAFEIISNKIDYSSTFGLLSAQGFVRPIYIFLRALGVSAIDNLDYKYAMLDGMIQITEDEWWNSAFTGLGFIYVDAGTVGVVVIMAIIGYVCMSIYKKVRIVLFNGWIESYASAKYICLYCFSSLLIIQMFADLASANIRYGMAVIYLVIAIRVAERIKVGL